MTTDMIDTDAIELPVPEPDDEELEPAAAAGIVKLEGIVSKSARLYTDVDTSMPLVQFGLELTEPVEGFDEVIVQVRGNEGMIAFAMLFQKDAQASAEGRIVIQNDGAWVYASMLGLTT